jgi:SAM-dependent methyltransferase
MERRNVREQRRLYGDLAWTWSIISPPDNYVEESETFARTIKKYSKIESKTLLHLGCGGGHNDYTFKKYFEVTGVDISEKMLELARKLNPEVEYRIGDMRSIRMEERFDAVIILDSINYMRTEDELRTAFLTAYEHLKSGGAFLTLPEMWRGKSKQNQTNVTDRSKGDVEIAFIENYYDPDIDDTECEGTFIFLIRRKGKLEIQTDHHVFGLFELETWRKLLREVGFEINELKFTHSSLKEGDFYPMFVCIKE